MATTVSNIVNSLKYVYGVNKVQYLFNQESPTYNMLAKVKKGMGGRGQFIIPLFTKNAGAWKGIAEGGALPTALAPATAEATFALHEFTGMADTTWKLIQDSRNDKFAFQTVIQTLGDSLKRRIFRNLNADFIDNGKGRLAVWTVADDTSGFTSAFQPRLETGMVIDVMAVSDDDTKRGDSLTVTGYDPVAKTFTTGANPSSTAAGDYAVIEDTCDVSVTTTSLHTNGLLGVVSDANPASVVGNYGGINRSTAGNEYWKAAVLSNSGTNRPLTEDLLLQAQDAVRIKGGAKLDAWISNMPIVRRYHEMLSGERYFALSKPGVLSGGIGRGGTETSGDNSTGDGASPYEFSGIRWYVDPYFTNNVILGLDTSHFFIGVGENEVPRPVGEIFDNVPYFRQTNNATFEIPWYFQCELLSDNPAAGVQVQDVAEA
jgi:hypothetical protein